MHIAPNVDSARAGGQNAECVHACAVPNGDPFRSEQDCVTAHQHVASGRAKPECGQFLWIEEIGPHGARPMQRRRAMATAETSAWVMVSGIGSETMRSAI